MNIKIKELFVILILFGVSILVYAYRIFPQTEVWQTKYYTFKSPHFEDVSFMAWIFFTKLTVFVILFVWFLTNSHWWRYFLIVPIVIEIYKIIGLFDLSRSYIDEDDYIRSLPIVIPVVLLLFFFARRVHYFHQAQRLLEVLNDEIDANVYMFQINSETNTIELQKEFELLKKRKKTLKIEDYIDELFKLRDRVMQAQGTLKS